MSFHIGQKVVCINDEWPAAALEMVARCGFVLPVRGAVYTIREIDPDFFGDLRGDGLRFDEIVNPTVFWLTYRLAELAFGSPRFRPITERKTDISIFKRILADCDHRVDAPCDVEA